MCFQLTADHAILRNCTWHPTQALLAFSAGSLVYVVDVPTAIKTIGTSDVSLTLSELAALPSGCTVLSCPGQAAVHALAFDNRNGLVAGLANGRVCQFTLSGIVDRVESRPIVGRLQSTFDTNATGVTSVSTVIPVSPGTIIVGTNQNTTLSLWTSTETGSHQCIHTLHLQWTPAVHDIKNYATCVFDELSHNVFVWPGGKIEGVVLHVEGASSEAPQWTVRGTVAQEERVASPTLSTVVVRNEVVTSAFSVLTKAIIRVELPPMHAHLDVEWPIIEGGGATTTDAVTSPTTAATLVKLATGVSPSKSESSTKNAHPLTATAKASPKQAPVSPRGGVVQPSPVKKPVMDALAATVAPVVNNISSRVSSPVSPALGVESAPAVTAIREIECNKDASGETSLVKPKPRTEEAVASQTAPNAALAPSLTAAEITTAVEIAVKKESMQLIASATDHLHSRLRPHTQSPRSSNAIPLLRPRWRRNCRLHFPPSFQTSFKPQSRSR